MVKTFIFHINKVWYILVDVDMFGEKLLNSFGLRLLSREKWNVAFIFWYFGTLRLRLNNFSDTKELLSKTTGERCWLILQDLILSLQEHLPLLLVGPKLCLLFLLLLLLLLLGLRLPVSVTATLALWLDYSAAVAVWKII